MELENNIPIPETPRKYSKVTMLLFDAEVGQSLLVTVNDVNVKARNLYNACDGYTRTVMFKHRDRRFKIIKIDETSCGIWRLK